MNELSAKLSVTSAPKRPTIDEPFDKVARILAGSTLNDPLIDVLRAVYMAGFEEGRRARPN